MDIRFLEEWHGMKQFTPTVISENFSCNSLWKLFETKSGASVSVSFPQKIDGEVSAIIHIEDTSKNAFRDLSFPSLEVLNESGYSDWVDDFDKWVVRMTPEIVLSSLIGEDLYEGVSSLSVQERIRRAIDVIEEIPAKELSDMGMNRKDFRKMTLEFAQKFGRKGTCKKIDLSKMKADLDKGIFSLGV